MVAHDLSLFHCNYHTDDMIDGVLVSTILRKAILTRSSGKKRLPFKRRLIVKIAQRDGKCCMYCKKSLEFAWMGNFDPTQVATFEHIQVASKGGKLTEKNGYIACQPCNADRSDQDLNVYLARVKDGFYTKEAKAARKFAKAEKWRIHMASSYKARVKRRLWKARKEKFANFWRIVYSMLHSSFMEYNNEYRN